MSSFGGKGSSRGGRAAASGTPNTTTTTSNDGRKPRAGFNAYNARGRASNQLRLNGSTRGGLKQPTTSAGAGGPRGRGATTATTTPSSTFAARAENTGNSSSRAGGNAASHQDRWQLVGLTRRNPSTYNTWILTSLPTAEEKARTRTSESHCSGLPCRPG